MKNFVKGLTALLIFGSFIIANCESVEAAEIADFTKNSIETQELARHPHYPPPPRHDDDHWKYSPPRHGHRHEPRPLPPPPRHGHRPPPPPHHHW